jgi:hypothetical protein
VISILPITRLVGIVAVSYATCTAIIVGLIWRYSEEPTFWSSAGIAVSGATALNLFLLLIIYVGWKWLWSWFPMLDTLVFPNINGSWRMLIHWQKADGNGIIRANAIIKQDLLRISMEVSSRDSDSETLIAYPRRDPESGRPILYYVYRVIPKNINPNTGPSYEGAAILKVSNSGMNELSGNYFTSRQTNGYFHLTR